jgi:hypothetical protein
MNGYQVIKDNYKMISSNKNQINSMLEEFQNKKTNKNRIQAFLNRKIK